MRLKIYQIDAFADTVFDGNPAAVVPLRTWLDDAVMQAIAAENNLAETAFFVPKGEYYHLRWFTPTHEVPLCGHATLASAFIVFTTLDPSCEFVEFNTLSGVLNVSKDDNGFITMDFPKFLPVSCKAPADLLEGLNRKPIEVWATESDSNYYAVYKSEEDIHLIRPNLPILEKLHPYGVVVTARGDEADFVSRYFAPSYGIPEDPVTGSIHCALVPLWSERLGKSGLLARQVSKRGGELMCEVVQDRVRISGRAVKYLEGYIYL